MQQDSPLLQLNQLKQKSIFEHQIHQIKKIYIQPRFFKRKIDMFDYYKNLQNDSSNNDNLESIRNLINEFQTSNRQVLLIEGYPGIGKTTLAKKLELIFWNLPDCIPITTTCPIQDNFFFQSLNLNSDEIQELLSLQQKQFIFILDQMIEVQWIFQFAKDLKKQSNQSIRYYLLGCILNFCQDDIQEYLKSYYINQIKKLLYKQLSYHNDNCIEQFHQIWQQLLNQSEEQQVTIRKPVKSFSQLILSKLLKGQTESSPKILETAYSFHLQQKQIVSDLDNQILSKITDLLKTHKRDTEILCSKLNTSFLETPLLIKLAIKFANKGKVNLTKYELHDQQNQRINDFLIAKEWLKAIEILPLIDSEFLSELISKSQNQLESQNKSSPNLILKILQQIENSVMNKWNISENKFQYGLVLLKEKINDIGDMKQKLIQIIQLSAISTSISMASSNCLFLLIYLGVNVQSVNFQNICIKDTTLNNGFFHNCNFSGSIFDKVNVSTCNFQESNFSNTQWQNLDLIQNFKIYPGANQTGRFISQNYLLRMSILEGKALLSIDHLRNNKTVHQGYLKSTMIEKDDQIAIYNNIISIKKENFTYIYRNKLLNKKKHNQIGYCRISPNGQYLGICSNFILTVTNLFTNTEKTWITLLHKGSFAFSMDNKNIAIQIKGEKIELWNLITNLKYFTYNFNLNFEVQILFSAKFLAINYDQNKIQIFDHHSEYNIETQTDVCQMEFSRNEKILAICCKQRIMIWRTQDWSILTIIRRSNNDIFLICFSPDDNRILSGSTIGLGFWNVASQALRFEQIKAIQCMAISPNGQLLATGGQDSVIRLWNLNHYALWACLLGHSSKIQTLVFSPDNCTIASSSTDLTIKLWNVEKLQEITSLKVEYQITSIAFHPSRNILAYGGEDQTIRIWDLTTISEFANLQGHTFRINYLAFFDRLFLISSGEGEIIIWNVDYQYQTKKIISDNVGIFSICPINNLLAFNTSEQYLKLFNLKTLKEIKFPESMLGSKNKFDKVSFSKDGRFIASANSWNIKIWDLQRHVYLGQLTVEGCSYITFLQTKHKQQLVVLTTGNQIDSFDDFNSRIHFFDLHVILEASNIKQDLNVLPTKLIFPFFNSDRLISTNSIIKTKGRIEANQVFFSNRKYKIYG